MRVLSGQRHVRASVVLGTNCLDGDTFRAYGRVVTFELRPIAPSDAEAQCAGEDDLTVRWLTGGYGEVDGTREYIEGLVRNAEAGVGKRAFGMWLSDRMCGYIEYNPDLDDGLEPNDVNLSYGVHPSARGRGVAVEAVRLVCDVLRCDGIGSRAAILVEPENTRSVRVAQKAGFSYVRDFPSARNTNPDGSPITYSLYLLDLLRRPLIGMRAP